MADQRRESDSAADVAEAKERKGLTRSNAGKGRLHPGSPVADLQQGMQRRSLASGKCQASHR